MKTPNKSLSLSVPAGYRVDRNRGCLSGVALISGDREAKGHGLYVDQATIDGAGAIVAQRGGRLKAGIRHASWSDWMATGGDRILDLPGFFSSLTVKGNQLVGDMEFYDSFKTRHAADFAHLLEVAEKTPELVGLSVEMWGYAVYVGVDGTEYSERPKDIALKYDGLPAFRVTDLTAAAFVDEPAANDGLFAQFSASFAGKQEPHAVLRQLFSAFLSWAREQPGLNAFPSAPSSEKAGALAPSLSNQSEDKTMTTLAALKAKFGADKGRHTRALELLSEDDSLSVESIEAKLAAADQTALQATVTQLTADNKTLATKVTDLEAKLTTANGERDQWKQKFEQLKASGLTTPLVLASAGAAPAATPPTAGKQLTGRSRVAAAIKAQLADAN